MQHEKIIDDLQDRLGRLAEQYRSLPSNSSLNKQVIADYHKVFNELIRVNGGIIALEPDEELPDRLMPKEYVNHWLS